MQRSATVTYSKRSLHEGLPGLGLGSGINHQGFSQGLGFSMGVYNEGLERRANISLQRNRVVGVVGPHLVISVSLLENFSMGAFLCSIAPPCMRTGEGAS